MTNKSERKMLSIIIPVYNEEGNVRKAYDSVSSVMEEINDKYEYELLFTDNHSTDNTFGILEKLSQTDSHIRVLRFSRNFGYQRSILTGYLHSRGDMAIQLDCDMQDPPELIPKFLEKWENGFAVVYGIRESRQEGWVINCVRKLFYRLINLLSEDQLPKDVGDFQLIDRKVINVIKQIQDSRPYLRGAIASAGFKRIGFPYKRNLRIAGKGKFKSSDLISLAIDGILNHSIVPLRIATFTGFIVSILAVVLTLIYFLGKLIYGPLWDAGFATTTVLILISIGLNGFFLGIIGEYIGRIYKQVKGSYLTIIEETINI